MCERAEADREIEREAIRRGMTIGSMVKSGCGCLFGSMPGNGMTHLKPGTLILFPVIEDRFQGDGI